MRKRAKKLLALLTAVTITVTGVNVPAAQAAKVKVTASKTTLYYNGTGAEKKATVTVKNVKGKKVTYSISKAGKKIVKLGDVSGNKTKKFTVTAKKAGKATVTVKVGGKKVKSIKFTVKKKTTKATPEPTVAPTQAPTQEPTQEPTVAPSDAPSDAPTQAPAELGKLVSVEAKTASEIVATFDAAVPADTKVTLTKGADAIEGTSAIEDKTVTFTSSAKLTAGTYTFTAELGDKKESKDIVIDAEAVASIEITSAEALTGKSNTEAYAHYVVKNQYGDDITASTNVTWTASKGTVKADRATGMIKVSTTAADKFQYASILFLNGVDVKSGKSCQKELKIGLERAVDSIDFAGFANVNEKKLLETLPANFAKDSYVLLYTTLDQNGDVIEASTSNVADKNITFIHNNALLLDLDLKDAGKVYTINGVDYNALAVNPGTYVDRGGEVIISAVSNKTGKKTDKVYTVGNIARLQKLTVDAPATTIAEFDTDVKLPYTAVDTQGNTITDYDTIVRSTNELSLKATRGNFFIKEENDGTAGVYWSDDKGYSSIAAADYYESSASDNQDTVISLTSVVIGGDSSNVMLSLADVRRPSGIKSVTFSPDSANAFVEGQKAYTEITNDGDNQWAKLFIISYVDQYGKILDYNVANAFFNAAAAGNGFAGNYYGVKVQYNESNTLGLDGKGTVLNRKNVADQKLTFTAASTANAEENAVKFSIASINIDELKKQGSTIDFDTYSDWADESKVVTKTYTTVPVKKLTDMGMSTLSAMHLDSDNVDYPNGVNLKGALPEVATADALSVTKATNGENPAGELDVLNHNGDAGIGTFKVTGSYAGSNISIPSDWWEIDGIKWSTDGAGSWKAGARYSVEAVTDVTWGDLYDTNTAQYTRKTGSKKASLYVYNTKDTNKWNPEASYFKLNDVNWDALTGTAVEMSAEEIAGVVTGDKKKWTVTGAYSGTVESDLFLSGYAGPVIKTASQTLLASNSQNVKISDAASVPTTISVDSKTVNPENTALTLVSAKVVDQYGISMNGDLSYKVTLDGEASDTKTYLVNSFAVSKNGSASAAITGAEIGDKYSVVVTELGTGIKAEGTYTVGADTLAVISSIDAKSTDKAFRKNTLKINH